ncbi:MAG TPA: peroxiredoxin [Thermoanaerobaculia bacterium]
MSKVFRNIVVLAFILVSALSAVAAEFPPVGKPAPDFWLHNEQGNGMTLKDFSGKWVVLYFYPRDFTKGCSIEAQKFAADWPKYQAANATIVGISVDGPDSHKTFCEMNKLPFHLLSDSNGAVSTSYNSFTQLAAAKISERNTFLIDPKGNLVKIFTKVNPVNHSAQVLKALAELQAAKK